MTDRERQIAEMAKEVLSIKVQCKGQECNKHIPCTTCYAEHLYNAGYRKMDEVTLKLDLGDRQAEEIQQIAEAFNGEIKKQVAKEIIDSLLSECDSSPYDCVEPNYILYLAKKYGVEIGE